MTEKTTQRSAAKAAARQRILDSASRRLRGEGLKGAGINPVMADAGLTRGTFYAHFKDKDTLAREAFRHAIDTDQSAWLDGEDASWSARVARLSNSYLSKAHRDAPEQGCAIAALASELTDAPESFREHYGDVVLATFQRIAEENPERMDDAIAILAMLTGGINLARNVPDEQISERVLTVCRKALETLAQT